MKAYFLIICLLVLSTCYAQEASVRKTFIDSLLRPAIQDKKVNLTDFSSGRLILLVNGIIVKDSGSISRLFISGQKNKALIRFRYYSPEKAQNKFGLKSEMGVLRLWVKERSIEL